MNLSKSKYCMAVQCLKMLWLNENKPEVKKEIDNESVLDNGIEVGIKARELLGEHVNISFNKDLQVMIKETKEYLKKDNIVITEASFGDNNNFCSVDILRKKGDKLEIYEVKSATEINDIYYDDLAYQVMVVSSLGYNVSKALLVYINSKYERKKELELDKLFKVEDVTKKINEKLDEVKNNLEEIKESMKRKNEPSQKIGMHCFTPYECPFFDYCTKSLPENNVFKIRRMPVKKKLELYNKGAISYDELLKEDIDTKFRQQIDFELKALRPDIKRKEIKKFLKQLSYPLYFLDFETFQQAIPKYEGVRPYMQIPFQYSLHYILQEKGEVEHKEFLAEADIDPRRSLAEKLVEDIPLNVTTLAYNMSFEKTVIKNLANLYPDLKEHLMNIHDNIKDLMIPFKERYYYTKDMHGSFSIKYVLPALFPNEESLNYQNLELIHKGGEAMSAYANLGKLRKEEQKKVREALLKYCELDTYAMVKIYQKLKEEVMEVNS